jgi:hypothetical protein
MTDVRKNLTERIITTTLTVVIPVVAIGWAARDAMNRLETKANEAVARVQAALVEVKTKEELHEAVDGQWSAWAVDRMTRIEKRQDTIEEALAKAGLPLIKMTNK